MAERSKEPARFLQQPVDIFARFSSTTSACGIYVLAPATFVLFRSKDSSDFARLVYVGVYR